VPEGHPGAIQCRHIHAAVVLAATALDPQSRHCSWRLHMYHDAAEDACIFSHTGDMLISTGELNQLNYVDVLASTMAHEAAHAICQHRQESRAVGVLAAAADSLLAAAAPDSFRIPSCSTAHVSADGRQLWGLRSWRECAAVLLSGRAEDLALQALSALYWRRCEAEADFVGFSLAQAAGFGPDGGRRYMLAEDIWQQRAEKAGLVEPASWWERLTSSHPDTGRRAEALAVLTLAAGGSQPRERSEEAQYPLMILGDESWRWRWRQLVYEPTADLVQVW